jgi:hypothetical protein
MNSMTRIAISWTFDRVEPRISQALPHPMVLEAQLMQIGRDKRCFGPTLKFSFARKSSERSISTFRGFLPSDTLSWTSIAF